MTLLSTWPVWFLCLGIIITISAEPCGPCCDPCPSHDVDLEAVYDPFVPCGCYEAISGPIRSANISATTGFAGGPVTLTWNGVNAWTAIIGTVTVDFYGLASCAGIVIQTEVYDATMFVQCGSVGGTAVFSLGVGLVGNNIGNNLIFSAGAVVSLDAPTPNGLACGTDIPGVLGDVTISLA